MVARRKWAEALAAAMRSGFAAHAEGARTLGREAELPLVRASTGGAADTAELWEALRAAAPARMTTKRQGELVVGLACEDYEVVSEVGRGTIEIVTRPANDLHELASIYEDALVHVTTAAASEGVDVLGYGIQPRTGATPALLTPKPRYRALHQVLGPPWLAFTTTAADQCHVSVTRDEAIEASDTVNLLAPLVVALTANSPVSGGVDLGVCSGRESIMRATGMDTVTCRGRDGGTRTAARARHGMPHAPACDFVSHVESLLMHRTLIDPANHPLSGGSGCEWLERLYGMGGVVADEATGAPAGVIDEAREFFEKHEHYVWHSARPRPLHGTVEVRAACQQPVTERHATPALALGLVGGWRECREAVLAHFSGRMDAAWAACSEWHARAARDGLAAREPAPGLIDDVLAACDGALRARGLGEEDHLAPLRGRARDGKNPAQVARDVFVRGGVDALIEHATFPVGYSMQERREAVV